MIGDAEVYRSAGGGIKPSAALRGSGSPPPGPLAGAGGSGTARSSWPAPVKPGRARRRRHHHRRRRRRRSRPGNPGRGRPPARSTHATPTRPPRRRTSRSSSNNMLSASSPSRINPLSEKTPRTDKPPSSARLPPAAASHTLRSTSAQSRKHSAVPSAPPPANDVISVIWNRSATLVSSCTSHNSTSWPPSRPHQTSRVLMNVLLATSPSISFLPLLSLKLQQIILCNTG